MAKKTSSSTKVTVPDKAKKGASPNKGLKGPVGATTGKPIKKKGR